jgi:hypothetical protein
MPFLILIPALPQLFISLMGESESIIIRANGRHFRLPDISRFVRDWHMSG